MAPTVSQGVLLKLISLVFVWSFKCHSREVYSCLCDMWDSMLDCRRCQVQSSPLQENEISLRVQRMWGFCLCVMGSFQGLCIPEGLQNPAELLQVQLFIHQLPFCKERLLLASGSKDASPESPPWWIWVFTKFLLLWHYTWDYKAYRAKGFI